jgi:DNA-directed RNA polymerase subunit RPC12/RpoP
MREEIECKYCGAMILEYPCYDCGYENNKNEQDIDWSECNGHSSTDQ